MKNRSPEIKDSIRALLKQIRKEAGLRQVDLATKLGKPQSYVSKYESGERSLDLVEVWEICRAAGVEFSKFVKTLEEHLES